MDFELYKYIIDQIMSYGGIRVNLNRFGESLLYPQFIEAVRYAKGKGVPRVGVVTNATLLTEELSEAIIHSGLDYIHFSIDTLDPEQYAAGRVGSDLNHVLANVNYFLTYKRQHNLRKPLVGINAVLMHDNFEQLKRLYEYFCKECRINVKPVGYYGNSQSLDEFQSHNTSRYHPCIQLWQRMNFFHNGDVNLCCGDVTGELCIGNIKEQSIKELWYGTHVKELRRLHTRLDFDTLKLCQRCCASDADWCEKALQDVKEIYAKLDPSKKILRIQNTKIIME